MTPPLGKLTFLVVDDNANMVQIIKAVLKSFGVLHIYDARGAPEALAQVREHAIDIVLLDFNLGLGATDGIEFIRQVRNSPERAQRCLPIIMLTAYTEEHHVLEARDAGVTEFCCKPVTPIEIYRKIAEVVEHPRDFISATGYFGPDRRRHDDAAYEGPERRAGRQAAPPLETGFQDAKAG